MNAHLPVVGPLLCPAGRGATLMHQKKKMTSTNCLGVPRPKGEIILVTDACVIGGGGTLYQ